MRNRKGLSKVDDLGRLNKKLDIQFAPVDRVNKIFGRIGGGVFLARSVKDWIAFGLSQKFDDLILGKPIEAGSGVE